MTLCPTKIKMTTETTMNTKNNIKCPKCNSKIFTENADGDVECICGYVFYSKQQDESNNTPKTALKDTPHTETTPKTADRGIYRKTSQKLPLIKNALKDGLGINQVAKLSDVSNNTILSIIEKDTELKNEVRQNDNINKSHWILYQLKNLAYRFQNESETYNTTDVDDMFKLIDSAVDNKAKGNFSRTVKELFPESSDYKSITIEQMRDRAEDIIVNIMEDKPPFHNVINKIDNSEKIEIPSKSSDIIVPPKPIIPDNISFGRKCEIRHAYFEKKKPLILTDVKMLGAVETCKKWDIYKSTMDGLLKRWNSEQGKQLNQIIETQINNTKPIAHTKKGETMKHNNKVETTNEPPDNISDFTKDIPTTLSPNHNPILTEEMKTEIVYSFCKTHKIDKENAKQLLKLIEAITCHK